MIYELLLLTSDDKEKSKEIYNLFKGKFTKTLKDQEWGLKKLAYKINNLDKGYYFLIIGEADKKIREVLEYELKTNKDFVRYMLINLKNELKRIDDYVAGKLITKWEYKRPVRNHDYKNSKTGYKKVNYTKTTNDKVDNVSKGENDAK